MKKIWLLILMEILVSIACVVGVNYYLFGVVTLNMRPLVFVFHLGWRMMSVRFILVLCGFGTGWVIQLILVFQSIRKSFLEWKNRSTGSHGTSRWATIKEMRKNALLNQDPTGIILGQTFDACFKERQGDADIVYTYLSPGRLISSHSQHHIAIIGGTGSGKDVGIIIPTLLTCKDTVLCVDPKGESYEKTAGFRSRFSNVYKFDPTSEDTCHINALDFIPRDVHALSNIEKLVLMLHPDQSKEPYWDNVPRMIMEMLIGHVLIFGETHSLPEAARIINDPRRSHKELFKNLLDQYDEMLETQANIEKNPLFPVLERIQGHANEFYQLAKGPDAQQLVTHITVVKRDLGPYSNPIAAKATSFSDFQIKDVADGNRPMSLYFCVPLDELQRTIPMFKMIFSLIHSGLTGRQRNHKNKVLMIYNEFSQFGKFEEVEKKIPIVRGYGIRYMIVIQSLGQLDLHYTQSGTKALIDNFQTLAVLQVQDNDTAAWIERRLGSATLLQKKTSFSGGRRSGLGVEGWSEGTSEIGRPLMTASEVQQMPGDQMLILISRMYPIRAKRILYYSDKRFSKLTDKPVKPPRLPVPELPDSSFKRLALPVPSIADWELNPFSVDLENPGTMPSAEPVLNPGIPEELLSQSFQSPEHFPDAGETAYPSEQDRTEWDGEIPYEGDDIDVYV